VLGTLERRVLVETATSVRSSTLAGFGGTGRITLDPRGSLRNVKVDPTTGQIWVVAYDANRIYNIAPDGTTTASVTIEQPFDIGFNGRAVIVSHNFARNVTAFDSLTLAPAGSQSEPPWSMLGLVPMGLGEVGALTGLVVIPGKGFYVANEAGATTTDALGRYNVEPILFAATTQ
jgi:hypothetical protein